MHATSSILRRTAVVFSALGFLGVAACGGGSDNPTVKSSTPAAGKFAQQDPTIAAAVPAALRTKGTLTIASDASYAPNEYFDTDGKTIIGMSVDLATALGEVMGLKVKFVNAKFDNIIPALASGRYDISVSSFTDNKEREKTVDFVTYFSAGTQFFANSDGPDITGLEDLCGHSLAVERGTTQAADATKQSTKCTGEGKKKVDVQTYPDQNAANLALKSKRAELSAADSPVAAYQVTKSNGSFKLVGEPYGTAPYGIALPKNSGLAQPLLDALKKLIAAGTYKTILEKWNVEAGAITDPVINGAQG
jgi:polar amino acid transport system substrate-binding protein